MILVGTKPQRKSHFLRNFFVTAVLFLIVFYGVFYFIQPKIAFNHGKSKEYHHPTPEFKDYWMPDELGMAYKNLSISSPVKSPFANSQKFYNLYGWFVYHEGISDQIPTIVYFHENDYFPPARLYMIQKLFENPQKYNVIMVDYRGYGYSEGISSEDGIYNDCHAIMDHVFEMEEIDRDQVFIFGASMGGAFATYSALNYQDRVKGLILQNTIVSVQRLAELHAPIMKPILPYILRIHLPTNERIPKINLPMMFVIGLEDTATFPEEMYELFDLAENSAPFREVLEIPGCEHYLPWYYGGEEYDEKLTSFIDRSLEYSYNKKSDNYKLVKDFY